MSPGLPHTRKKCMYFVHFFVIAGKAVGQGYLFCRLVVVNVIVKNMSPKILHILKYMYIASRLHNYVTSSLKCDFASFRWNMHHTM